VHSELFNLAGEKPLEQPWLPPPFPRGKILAHSHAFLGIITRLSPSIRSGGLPRQVDKQHAQCLIHTGLSLGSGLMSPTTWRMLKTEQWYTQQVTMWCYTAQTSGHSASSQGPWSQRGYLQCVSQQIKSCWL